MTNYNIKTFREPIIVKDSGIWAQKYDSFYKFVVDKMRGIGYVPILDMNAEIHVEYKEAKEEFLYILTIYGRYVGKKKAMEIEGISDGKIVPKPLRPPK